jgi:hypothetical protein
MFLRIAVVILSILALIGLIGQYVDPSSSVMPQANDPVIFDFSLIAGAGDMKPSDHPRPALIVENRGINDRITTCREYVGIYPPLEPVPPAYADCYDVYVLDQATAPETFLAPASQLGRFVANQLDLRALGPMIPAWARPAYRLDDVKEAKLVVHARSLMLEHHDGRWTLDIVASGDFTETGIESLMVRITEEPSGRISRVFLGLSQDGLLVPVAPRIQDKALAAWPTCARCAGVSHSR